MAGCVCPVLQLLRVVDSLQLAAKLPVATPADWQKGEEVMIAPRVSNEEAEKLVSLRVWGRAFWAALRAQDQGHRMCRLTG